MTPQTERHIAQLFNEMAAEYDQLEDEWYPHLFRQIERVVQRHAAGVAGERAIDVGCGTGFQTTILEGLGYQTVGIDIAGDLVARAREKLATTGSRAQFCVASALDIPFPAGWFDLANCSGSTLSFVPDYPVPGLSRTDRRLPRWCVRTCWHALSARRKRRCPVVRRSSVA